MRKWLSFLLLFMAAFFISVPAWAQSSTGLSSLEVDIWPEYDRPDVLVIYRLTLSPNTPLPADLTIPIPVAAGEPTALAAKQVDGSLINVGGNTQKISGAWNLISFKATMPEIQVEYYDPGLVKQNASRHFEFTWPGGLKVDSVNVQVQEPVDTTNMRITPSLGAGAVGKDGLNYYQSSFGSLNPNQDFKISLDYQKTTDKLSGENMGVAASQDINSNTPGRIKLTDALPWALGAFGLVLLFGGALWYWLTGRKLDGPQRPKRLRGKRQEPEAVLVGGDEGIIYCHQCGKRAGPGDRFCRSCGVKLRPE
ncbi:MAG: zinc ribbon domain-containing protein [Omnitrophica WOR_2 bacterium]